MSGTHPIKNKNTLEKFKNYYVNVHPNSRNYAMIVIGLNTAFRISDLLRMQWRDVWDNDMNFLRSDNCLK